MPKIKNNNLSFFFFGIYKLILLLGHKHNLIFLLSFHSVHEYHVSEGVEGGLVY